MKLESSKVVTRSLRFAFWDGTSLLQVESSCASVRQKNSVAFMTIRPSRVWLNKQFIPSCWNDVSVGSKCLLLKRDVFIVFMAHITAMVLCARSRESLHSVSMLKAYVVFSTTGIKSGWKPSHKTREIVALRWGILAYLAGTEAKPFVH